MTIPTLIYCADGNARYAEIALRHRFTYGAQLPNKVYFEPDFVDNRFKKPEREAYMQALTRFKPKLATVLDLEYVVRNDDGTFLRHMSDSESEARYQETLSWAREASEYVSHAVIIIPKVFGVIQRLREDLGHEINGKEIRLGYSVPTRFAGTEVPIWEFNGWPIHLLGGSPNEQLKLCRLMDVRSADGNYASKMANEFNQFYANGTARYAKNRFWPQLQEASLGFIDNEAPTHCFTLSCINIAAAWRGNTATIRYATPADVPAVKKIADQYKNELGWVRTPALLEATTIYELYIALMGQQIVGFINFHLRLDGWHKIYEIAVHREWKGKGIGSALLNALPDPIRVSCPVDNASNVFYEKEGFTLVRTEDGRKRAINVWERNQVPLLRRVEGRNSGKLRDKQAPVRRQPSVPKDVPIMPKNQAQPVLFEMSDGS